MGTALTAIWASVRPGWWCRLIPRIWRQRVCPAAVSPTGLRAASLFLAAVARAAQQLAPEVVDVMPTDQASNFIDWQVEPPISISAANRNRHESTSRSWHLRWHSRTTFLRSLRISLATWNWARPELRPMLRKSENLSRRIRWEVRTGYDCVEYA